MLLTQILQKIRSAFYTKSETDNLLSGKSNTNHNHNSAYLGISAKAESAKSADSATTISQKIDANARSNTNYPNNGTYVPTMNFLSYWDGAYSSAGGSNLNYCANGVIIGSNNIGSQNVNYANSAGSANDPNAVHKSGNETINGMKTFNTEIVSTAAHSFRHIFGDYGVFWRQDGSNLYLLLTNKGDQYGGWNDFRPLVVNLATGICSINGNANSAGNSDTVDGSHAWQMQTLNASGSTHGSGAWLMQCQHNVDGDNLFKLYVGDKSIGTKVDRAGSADSATNATYANWLRTSSHSDHLFHTEWDGGYFWTYVTAGDGSYRAVRVARSDSAAYAERSMNNGAFYISGYQIYVG